MIGWSHRYCFFPFNARPSFVRFSVNHSICWPFYLCVAFQLILFEHSATHELFENSPEGSGRHKVYEQQLKNNPDAFLQTADEEYQK